MDRFLELLTNLNDFMWTYFLIGLVIVTGIYFTFSTKFVQFTYIKEMFRLITEKPKVGKDGEQKGVSAFQAFTISAASRVGTGTIAGVAIAIAMGWTRFSVLDVGYGFIWRSIIICRVYISPSI